MFHLRLKDLPENIAAIFFLAQIQKYFFIFENVDKLCPTEDAAPEIESLQKPNDVDEPPAEVTHGFETLRLTSDAQTPPKAV